MGGCQIGIPIRYKDDIIITEEGGKDTEERLDSLEELEYGHKGFFEKQNYTEKQFPSNLTKNNNSAFEQLDSAMLVSHFFAHPGRVNSTPTGTQTYSLDPEAGVKVQQMLNNKTILKYHV